MKRLMKALLICVLVPTLCVWLLACNGKGDGNGTPGNTDEATVPATSVTTNSDDEPDRTDGSTSTKEPDRTVEDDEKNWSPFV